MPGASCCGTESAGSTSVNRRSSSPWPSPHRPEAFAAARFAIDAIKASAPIWKHEEWDGGADWGTGAHAPIAASEVPTAQNASH